MHAVPSALFCATQVPEVHTPVLHSDEHWEGVQPVELPTDKEESPIVVDGVAAPVNWYVPEKVDVVADDGDFKV